MRFFCTITVFLMVLNCYAQRITGKVIRVSDGDSFTLLTDNNHEVRIRLYGIDCPEKEQPYSKAAKEFTGNILKVGAVEVEQKDIDRYNRIVGIVIVADSINLNEQLLKKGFAWHYQYYDNNPMWTAYERIARESKQGLWKEPNPISPWQWRKGVRSEDADKHIPNE